MTDSTWKTATRNALVLLLAISSLAPCSIPRAENADGPASPRENRTGSREDLIWKCRSCRLTLLDNEIVEGKLFDLRPDSLEIEHMVILNSRDPFAHKEREYHRRSVSFDEISSIRCGDPVIDGVILGAVIAALPTFFITEGVTGADEGDERVSVDWGIVASSTAIAGGIGAALGYLIDRVDNPPFEPDMETIRRAGRE